MPADTGKSGRGGHAFSVCLQNRENHYIISSCMYY